MKQYLGLVTEAEGAAEDSNCNTTAEDLQVQTHTVHYMQHTVQLTLQVQYNTQAVQLYVYILSTDSIAGNFRGLNFREFAEISTFMSAVLWNIMYIPSPFTQKLNLEGFWLYSVSGTVVLLSM